jgi:flavin-dependent dehydrogenase
MRTRFDAIVVGGGPGGSTCARALVGAGLAVAVLDKRTFPRDKPCGGWLTPQAIELLDLDLAEYSRTRTLQPIRGFVVGLMGGRSARVLYDSTVSHGARRCELDHYLLERSRASVLPADEVRALERRRGAWVINGTYEAPQLIGAGGHFCPVARALGRFGRPADTGRDTDRHPNGRLIVAREVETDIEAAGIHVETELEVPELYFSADLEGYGWCFRKGRFLNLGLGRLDPHALPAHVDAFVRLLSDRGRVRRAPVSGWHGHAYRVGPPRTVGAAGVLLVGDATGLADPRSGEGIANAAASGLLAARAVVASQGPVSDDGVERYRTSLIERLEWPTHAGDGGLMAGVRRRLAPWLLPTPVFTRHVVLDRWFLHRRPAWRHPLADNATAREIP